MKIGLYIAAALTAYLIAGWNPAITFSKAIYKTDIRTCGSKNPGFTNFKRCFGNKWAWFVFALDLLKAALVVILFAKLFEKYRRFSPYCGVVSLYLGAVAGGAVPETKDFHANKGEEK